MNSNFNSIVNKNEANALRDMIFARAREREKAVCEEVQDDVMDMARSSFKAENNPFSAFMNSVSNVNSNENKTVLSQGLASEKSNVSQEIGFPQNNPPAQIRIQKNMVNEQIVSTTIQNNMLEAREGLSNKKSFMGALNFLNSQAAISLIKTRADKFEVIV